MGTSKSRITAKAHKHYFCQNQQAMSSPALATTLETFLLTKTSKGRGLFFIL